MAEKGLKEGAILGPVALETNWFGYCNHYSLNWRNILRKEWRIRRNKDWRRIQRLEDTTIQRLEYTIIQILENAAIQRLQYSIMEYTNTDWRMLTYEELSIL